MYLNMGGNANITIPKEPDIRLGTIKYAGYITKVYITFHSCAKVDVGAAVVLISSIFRRGIFSNFYPSDIL